MGRANRHTEEGFGNDSFLDVIANIIGILIILVVVMGMRSKNAPMAEKQTNYKNASAALDDAKAAAASIEQEMQDITAEMQKVSMTSAARFQERSALVQAVTLRQRELDQKRAAMEVNSREEFDLQRALATAQAQLDRLAKERAAIDTSAQGPIEIKAFPTPISQTVYGHELHFQLKDDRVAPIAMHELLERFKHQAQQKVNRLRDQPELIDSVGPIDGFRLRYVLERVDTTDGMGQGSSYAQLRHFTLIPVSENLGEPLAEALGAHSKFRAELDGHSPRRTTVTLWTYQDSFPMFRALRKELHQLGFSVAGRPLNDGQPIGGSPDGTKSSAQ